MICDHIDIEFYNEFFDRFLYWCHGCKRFFWAENLLDAEDIEEIRAANV
jgi:hypothetical protein